jgi:hypothetical protein
VRSEVLTELKTLFMGLKMEIVCSSETPVSTDKFTPYYNPENKYQPFSTLYFNLTYRLQIMDAIISTYINREINKTHLPYLNYYFGGA